jgi:transcriptional regulator with XRE-family HTH domain
MSEIEWLNTFANNLARMLYEMKLTQRDLAEMSGISEGTISKYLNAQQMPGVKAILNISYATGCEISELIDFGTMIE